jgi:hypothetical protein
LWSVFPAACVREADLIGWRTSPQNLDPRLPCATSLTASPMIVAGQGTV